MRPLIIGVAGGSGSGKTTVANRILERVGTEHIAYIAHDAYYYDLAHLPEEERAKTNFDHPNSLETVLLIEHVKQLIQGQPAYIPVYDFTHHARTKETLRVDSAPIVIVEGILIYVEPELRDILDIKLFVDTDSDLRFIRRLRRDVEERGRTVDSVIAQYMRTVRPMHMEFVEPSKRYADVIIPEGGFNDVAIEMVAARIRTMLADINNPNPSC